MTVIIVKRGQDGPVRIEAEDLDEWIARGYRLVNSSDTVAAETETTDSPAPAEAETAVRVSPPPKRRPSKRKPS